jgi:hypothetical protein
MVHDVVPGTQLLLNAGGNANGYTDQGAEFGQSVPAVVSNALNPLLNVER